MRASIPRDYKHCYTNGVYMLKRKPYLRLEKKNYDQKCIGRGGGGCGSLFFIPNTHISYTWRFVNPKMK